MKSEISRVEVGSVFEKVDGKRLVTCYFDGYACFRNLCCFSRFYSDFKCPRFVKIAHLRVSPRLKKPDLAYRGAVKRKECSS